MILTLTPNPSLDFSLAVQTMERGGVCRATGVRREAGGKGVNVAHVIAKAGHTAQAIAPCGQHDPFGLAVQHLGIDFTAVAIASAVRTNTAITEADGTTTKINERGPHLSTEEREALENELYRLAPQAQAIVLAGSLPPGLPDNFYAQVVTTLRSQVGTGETLLAVDTSDAALTALGAELDGAAPNIMKPNAFELAQLTGADGNHLEACAADGDFSPVVNAAHSLNQRGVAEVLITLGGSGACLVTTSGVWAATPPPVTVRSTVGAGDSSLAGYIMARVEGRSPASCLQQAVAYGSAAATLPGTDLPSPADLDLAGTTVFPIN